MVDIRLNGDDNYDVLNDNGEIVGEVSVMGDTDIAYVEIAEEHRGNGYGPSGAGEVVERLLDEHGMVRMSTPVDDSLERVIRKYGFQEQYVMGDKLYVVYD